MLAEPCLRAFFPFACFTIPGIAHLGQLAHGLSSRRSDSYARHAHLVAVRVVGYAVLAILGFNGSIRYVCVEFRIVKTEGEQRTRLELKFLGYLLVHIAACHLVQHGIGGIVCVLQRLLIELPVLGEGFPYLFIVLVYVIREYARIRLVQSYIHEIKSGVGWIRDHIKEHIVFLLFGRHRFYCLCVRQQI